jgi:diacylglycerol kinase (ATP)
MRKRIKSFGFAIRGIRLVFGHEPNMNIHLAITALVILSGYFLSISLTEWIFCLICFGLVIGMEMMNSAIENVVDLASPEIHPLAAKAKDVAAGAVLICALLAAIVGLLIFTPKIWILVSGL